MLPNMEREAFVDPKDPSVPKLASMIAIVDEPRRQQTASCRAQLQKLSGDRVETVSLRGQLPAIGNSAQRLRARVPSDLLATHP